MRLRVIDNLPEVLEKHRKWLNDEEGGKCADLSYANLSSANLSSANLRFANLSFANLSSANLRFANLSSANLSSANLRFANLNSADLSSADLRFANLNSADLSSADLPNETWVIFGEPYFISISNGNLRAGCQCHDVADWRNFSDDEIREMDEGALEFYPRLLKIIDFYCSEEK